jgi:hypothetical protein
VGPISIDSDIRTGGPEIVHVGLITQLIKKMMFRGPCMITDIALNGRGGNLISRGEIDERVVIG